MGLAGRDLRPGFILTSVLGRSVAAALLWLYFDGEDERAERALRGADRARSPWLALYAFRLCVLRDLGRNHCARRRSQACYRALRATRPGPGGMVSGGWWRHVRRGVGVVSSTLGHGTTQCPSHCRPLGPVDRNRWSRGLGRGAARRSARHSGRWGRRRITDGTLSNESGEGVREDRS
jgi:hypothetical protein